MRKPLSLLLPLLTIASGPALLASLSRPVVMLDGDPAVFGPTSEDLLLTQVVKGHLTTEFGSALAFGNVNGDPYADAVVGQRSENKVFIYLGSANALATAYASDPNAADIVITAPTGAPDRIQQFGFSVVAADIDKDTYDDLIIGAPFSDPKGRTDQGLAWIIFSGGPLVTGERITLTDPSTWPAGMSVVKLTRGMAGKAGDLLGFAVATGSLASPPPPAPPDKYVVVTARNADATIPTVRTDAGAAHVVLGSMLTSAGSSFDLSTGSAVTFFGADPRDAFGESVTTCDVDAGGDEDLLVGAVFGEPSGGTGINRGESLLFLGENIVSGYHTGTVSAASADLSIHGRADGDDLGYSVACGNLNGDGLDDMVVGAIFADPTDPNGVARPTAGELRVFKGRISQVDPGNPQHHQLIDPVTLQPQGPIFLSGEPADLTLVGATTGDQLGFAAAVGDLDADGIGDLITSARRYDRDKKTTNVGISYILLGSTSFLDSSATIDLHQGTARDVDLNYSPGTPIDHLPNRVDAVIIGASREDHSGWNLATGDMDNDGTEELMISAIGDLARVPKFRGQAYILFTADVDGDGFSDPLDLDDDNDGLTDEEELAGTRTAGVPTDARLHDTDGDGLGDGLELGFSCVPGGVVVVSCDDPNTPFTGTSPSLPVHFQPDLDTSTQTDPLDTDSDDDGIADGDEDLSSNGRVDTGETNAASHDTDGDLVFDGTEIGLTTGLVDTNLAAGHFTADADSGASVTDPKDTDSDNDLVPDGVEDADHDGAVAGDLNGDHIVDATELWTETDAADNDTDRDGLNDGLEDRNRNGIRDAGETNPLDQDSDDDGLPDGRIRGANGGPTSGPFQTREGEDRDLDGVYGTADGESNPLVADTDGDSLPDGLEAGVPIGGGVAGRNTSPDTGPGEDGTDPTSANLVADADSAASTTNPASADSDGDLVPDSVEDADKNGAVAGDLNTNHVVETTEIWTETDPADNDTDRDGLTDGIEDRDRDGVLDSGETNPLDQDTDDDGLPDGRIDGVNGAQIGGAFQAREGEDLDLDGVYGTVDGESSPLLADSDGDMLGDGLEAGVPPAGGAPGRNAMPDTGPGGDGTDPTSANFRLDGDAGMTTTEPWDADTDDDGLPDGYQDGYNMNSGGQPGGIVDGIPSMYEGEDLNLDGMRDASETNAASRDTDGDGVKDGVELGVLSPGFPGPDMMPDPAIGGVQDGTSGSTLEFDTDEATLTNPLDADTDDDGISDSGEDKDGDGRVDAIESDPNDPDTDNDLLKDGLEAGVVTSVVPNGLPGVGGTDESLGNFSPDQDPATMTSFVLPDTDGGGATDGDEDTDRNGRVDAGERNPNFRGDDDRTGMLEFTDTLNGTATTAPIMAGTPIFLRIDDDTDQNTDPNFPEVLVVTCSSETPLPFDIETVAMTATAPNSAVFVGMLATNNSDPNIVNELTIPPGATIRCNYQDPDDPVDQRTATRTASLTAPPTVSKFSVEVPISGQIDRTPTGSSGNQTGTMTYNPHRGDLRTLMAAGVYAQTAMCEEIAGHPRPSTGSCAQ